MDADLDTLATALYVRVDDLLNCRPGPAEGRQLDLEAHGARTPTGVLVRVWQRLLALTAVIWHNDRIGAPTKRSLTTYDH